MMEEKLQLIDRLLAGIEARVTVLESKQTEHDERLEDCEEIFADIKSMAADQAAKEEVDFEAHVAGVKKRTGRFEE